MPSTSALAFSAAARVALASCCDAVEAHERFAIAGYEADRERARLNAISHFEAWLDNRAAAHAAMGGTQR